MNIGELLLHGKKLLQRGTKTPELESELLLAYVLQQPRAYLYAHREDTVLPSIERKFLQFVNRRKTGSPIAYILNEKEFYGLKFYVDERVLIPRPETETLVELVLEEVLKRLQIDRSFIGQKAFRIVDIGCGSGNIALTLMHLLKKKQLHEKHTFEIYLTDISGRALAVAKKNFGNLFLPTPNIRVHFVKTDLLKELLLEFDVIVSNAPYIPAEQIEYLDPTIRNFEPKVALDGGVGGLEIIIRLLEQVRDRLTAYGSVFLEIYDDHPTKISLLLKERFPDMKAEFFRDEFGDWRFCKVSR